MFRAGPAGAAQGEERRAEIGGQPVGAHHLEAPHRQFDGQRDAVDLLADAGDGRGIGVIEREPLDDGGGAIDE